MTSDQNPPKNAPERGSTFQIQLPTLTIFLPDGSQVSQTLLDPTIRIGRQEDNQVIIPVELDSISRYHAEIRQEDGKFIVVDLGSVNGVRVNGQDIEGRQILSDGDTIEIGAPQKGHTVRMVFHRGTDLADLAADQGLGAEAPKGTVRQPPPKMPYLQGRLPDGSPIYFPLNSPRKVIGRGDDADLQLPAHLRFVSMHHAELRYEDGMWIITDLHSTNGTRLYNQPLTAGQSVPLRDQAVIRMGDERLGVSVGFTFHDPGVQRPAEGFVEGGTQATQLTKVEQVLIGRAPDCTIVLNAPSVSRKHARIEKWGSNYRILDLESANGTYVNGKRIDTTEIRPGDLVQIEQFILTFDEGEIRVFESVGMRLDVRDLSKEVRARGGKLQILNDIDMTVMPREFVGLVGGSGAGKSTLMNALIGVSPAQGSIELNGRDFYRHVDEFRAQLGYVPQADILHTTLTVEQALNYAARLRLPPDVSAAERRDRIAKVLETVDMNAETLRKTRIGSLSGGQRKRVSIAAELLADPKLIYLDEATSGLDPGLEKKMMDTLRRMADEGRTVILITHATSNIVQADHVAFLSQGRLVYFGPPQEALSFFDVAEFADIYEQIDHRGIEWEKTFHEEKPEQYEKYIAQRQKARPILPSAGERKSRFGLRDFLRQFAVLTQRTLSVLISDPFTLGLLLALFPMVAALQLVIAKPDILTGDLKILADPVAAAVDIVKDYVPFASTNTFVFVTGLEAVLVGMYVPSNELIKERAIYLRERMVNLRMLPYLFAKILVFALFAILQVTAYLFVLSRGVNLPEQGAFLPGPIEMFITLFLTMIAGIGIGLLVSSLSRSTDMAIYVLVMLLFYQFFFAGTVFDLRDNPAKVLSYFTTTRWALTALGVTIDMPKITESTILCNDLPDNPLTPANDAGTKCFNYPDARDNLMLPYDKENLPLSWAILIGQAVLTIGLTGILIRRASPI